MSRLQTLVLLAVALFTGFVPLRRCHALDGASGVVPFDHHILHGHDDDSAVGHPAHDCGRDHDAPSSDPQDPCCVDTPFDTALAGDSVSLSLAAVLPPTPWSVAAALEAPAPVPTWARPQAPPDPLRSVRNVVLLR